VSRADKTARVLALASALATLLPTQYRGAAAATKAAKAIVEGDAELAQSVLSTVLRDRQGLSDRISQIDRVADDLRDIAWPSEDAKAEEPA
jgi:hypothetical protein